MSKLRDIPGYESALTIPVSADFLEVFREEWRKLGPAHRWVDRWRFDLGWNIEPDVVREYLAKDHPG